ncbi:hypothetical protein [Singulisphaera acidiphila]|uniref:Uncharacterized protein n=1 Tax=Singulisphaera acidiphila (strain ATCC BAA-1392 / DSM 18658 / VKM B-2454 / MOB10) TaxID=886293 RepID=L0DDU9_SINAD|nr:hypothetical protein [Singulisphaera acidiphila]AGA26836.1 hypothetical protein Sinac_2529 [Singulisphaera acidiphila DSM 18658]
MATEREIQEMIARCVSIMVFYYNSGRSAHTKDQMAAEVGAVAHFVKKWRLVDDLRVRILDSVTAEMIARYGSELGVRLDGEFYKAFMDADVPTQNHFPSEALL